MKKANRGNFGTCAKCHQQILWIKTINGKNMPVNARLVTYRVPKEGKRKRENRHTEWRNSECGNCTVWDAGCHRRRVYLTFCYLPGC